MMLRLILLFIVLVTSSLINSSVCQVLWQTQFKIPDKGIWADSSGNIIIDTTHVDWHINFNQCTFNNEHDYAKTVTTSGGRFEVLDSDGTVTWKSPCIDISSYDLVNLQFNAAETGSSSNINKKFIQPQLIIDNVSNAFTLDTIAAGNWGEKIFQETKIKGNKLQLAIKMNSSYASDKVYIDDVIIEAIDSKLLEPTRLKLTSKENIAFIEDTILISTTILNGYNQTINNRKLQLLLESENLKVLEISFNEGIYQWKLSPKNTGLSKFKISPINTNISSIEQSLYIIEEKDLIVNNNYENDSSIDQNTDWEISTQNAIAGIHSVKHKALEAEGNSTLQLLKDSIDLQQGHFQFRFKLQNGDWNPSSSNNFYIELMQNENGYAFGVNAKGSSDLFSMWKIEDGKIVELLMETDFVWKENITADIEIYRTAQGYWEVVIRDNEKQVLGSGNTFNNTFTKLNKLVLAFEFTKSRAGLLWFDDLCIAKVDIPPTITNVESIEYGTIYIYFNEAVDTTNFQLNQVIISSKEEKHKISKFQFRSNKVLSLSFEPTNKLNYQLQIKSVTDLNGNIAENIRCNFIHALPPKRHDLIINEIMADPTPSIGLPEVEYIELFNASNAYISTTDIGISINKKYHLLPDQVLSPKSYWLLCEQSDTSRFNTSNFIAVASLPALLNTGASIVISYQNEIIDSLFYTQNWYYDDNKKNGGYSLEKIDPKRFCGNHANWQASNNSNGGTPGIMNSIHASNIDLQAPSIKNIELISSRTITVEFSEKIDTSYFPEISVSPSLNILDTKFDNLCKTLTIEFSEHCNEEIQYKAKFENISDECGNLTTNLSGTFIWHHIEQNDVFLSEILFNPIEDGSDFFEIFNATGYSIDLAKLKVATRDDSLNLKSIYPLSSQSIYSNPNTFTVFTKDILNLTELFDLPENANYYQLEKMPGFNNDHGIIVLLNDSLEVIDEFEYDEKMHNQFIYDNEGISLERISFSQPTNNFNNWYSGNYSDNYATPCYANLNIEKITKDISIEIQTDVVSPNFDQYNDELAITFHLDQPEYLTNLFVFNMNGKMVAHPVNNQLVSNNATITYNCKTTNGLLLKSAPYFILVEMISANGSKHQLRESFYVSNNN